MNDILQQKGEIKCFTLQCAPFMLLIFPIVRTFSLYSSSGSLSPIRSNHGACLFLYDGVRTCFVEGVVFQIDLVEGALKTFQRHFALLGFQLAFPQDDGVPAEQTELDAFLHVALAVALNLGSPEGGACLGQDEVRAIFVAMPETSVDEDDCPIFSQHNVGGARQTFHVYAVAEPAGEEVAAHHHLGLRIAASDALHASVALFRCQSVGHGGILCILSFFVVIRICQPIKEVGGTFAWQGLHHLCNVLLCKTVGGITLAVG